jgi:hypothetical protein
MSYSKGEVFLGSPQPVYEPDVAELRSMRPRYDKRSPGFSFLAVDTNQIFFRQGEAYGGWSAGEAFYAAQSTGGARELGNTPGSAPATRYLRFTNATVPGDAWDLSEIKFFTDATEITPGPSGFSRNPTNEAEWNTVLLTNNELTNRAAYWGAAVVGGLAPAWSMTVDFGSVKTITGMKQAIHSSAGTPGRYATGFTLSTSSDGTNFTVHSTMTGIPNPGIHTLSDMILLGIPNTPIFGASTRGEIGLWLNPGTGVNTAYVCTASGTPGTWMPLS